MAKLTLSVDGRVVSGAKQYAKRQGVSISEMVEGYLAAVAGPPFKVTDRVPVLSSLRGVLRRGSVNDYRKHLVTKYR